MGIRILLSLLLCFALCCDCHAALRQQNAEISPKAAWNPKPLPNDILLPLPCDTHLVLRAVAVPGGIGNDLPLFMGVKQTDKDRALYESSFKTHIAASFTVQDLPPAWQTSLDVAKSDANAFYFVGKYEISQYQWDVVMQSLDGEGAMVNACPTLDAKGTLPVANVSWFDVQDFLQRVNAWLITNASAELPTFANSNNIGFLRLPTEEEWEFAARGGIRVKKEDRDNNETFLSETDKLQDFGVFQAEHGPVFENPLPIGSRKANPLGLFDMMGNVREMIDGFFHRTIAEVGQNNQQTMRLHGASGGVLCKGGSFRSEEPSVLPGSRDEMPLYTKKGSYRDRDLGFRVALVGISIPNASRLGMLQKERPHPIPAKSPKSPAKTLNLNIQGDPLEEFDRLMQANTSQELAVPLERFRLLLRNQKEALMRDRRIVLEDTMRATLYQAETIRAFAFRYIEVLKILQEEKAKNANPAATKKAKEYLDTYYQGLLTCANQYKNYVRKIAEVDQELIDAIAAQLHDEYAGKGSLNRHMLQNLATLQTHLDAVQNKGIESLNNVGICRDIIPKQHLQRMTHFTKR
ncbi:MAG: SUMF1/EgtB/PvdO family nonheme iron enzyme [Desulfovibrio sp.]|nr:SUMF1/EgtB/PvdO family nonheme iron enzyme [Desulfovibrio sp.]